MVSSILNESLQKPMNYSDLDLGLESTNLHVDKTNEDYSTYNLGDIDILTTVEEGLPANEIAEALRSFEIRWVKVDEDNEDAKGEEGKAEGEDGRRLG
ncbi:hypothetical protein BM1_03267 [Bipolaris maydis]|nr:hypothetical protein BM1_03267 [Bipolaris maydis]